MYLGIDLGTSNSAVMGMESGEPRLFKTPGGTDVLPSVIYRDRRGAQSIGVRAYEMGLLSPENVIEGFKRQMGSATPLRFESTGETLMPEQASAEILRALVGQAMMQSGAVAIEGAVVTIPAAFNQLQNEATLSAAHLAGLDRVALLQEPVAAALAATAGSTMKNGLFLIYDFGGGTFDAALVQIIDGNVTVLGHRGVNMLGGRDLDRAIVDNLVQPWLRANFALPADFAVNRKFIRLLRVARRAAEIAKVALSVRQNVSLSASEDEIRLEDESGNPIYLDVPISRADVERLGAGDVTRSLDCCRELIAEVGYRHEDIARVVLIGGPTKMPFLRRRVQDELGIQVESADAVDPMTAVAKGAAIYCESREWSAAGSGAKVSSHSEHTGGAVAVALDYLARTASEHVVLTVRQTAGAPGAEIELNDRFGRSSQRRRLSEPVRIEMKLHEIGPNRFQLNVFDARGMPVRDASREIVVERVLATTSGVPATHSIAVKIIDGQDRNQLDIIIRKGTPLPVSGVVRYRWASNLAAGHFGQGRIELYEVASEAVIEPHLNLCVGELRIDARSLPEATRLRRGDEVIVHYAMSESQVIAFEVELPSIGQRFSRESFYNWQGSLQNFAGEEGGELIQTQFDDAEHELSSTEEALPPEKRPVLDQLRDSLDGLFARTRGTVDADARRQIFDDIRLLRQRLAAQCRDPMSWGAVLRHRLQREIGFYDRDVAENATPDQVASVRRLERNGAAAMDRGTAADLDLAQEIIRRIDFCYWSHGYDQGPFCAKYFKIFRGQRWRAVDAARFDRSVAEGDAALARGELGSMRQILFDILNNRRSVADSSRASDKAWLMRV